jgi:hypothetical protein
MKIKETKTKKNRRKDTFLYFLCLAHICLISTSHKYSNRSFCAGLFMYIIMKSIDGELDCSIQYPMKMYVGPTIEDDSL